VSVTVLGEPKPAATEKFVLQGYAPNMLVDTTVAIGTGSVVESTEVEPSYTWKATTWSAEGNATSDGMLIIDLDDPRVTTVRLLGPRRPCPCPLRPTSPALPPGTAPFLLGEPRTPEHLWSRSRQH
jgi:hypothetical protein